jgi:hypothetical protein
MSAGGAHRPGAAVGRRSIDGTGLHCVCRRPYLGELMIACEGCDKWWHPACLGLDTALVLGPGTPPWWCAECQQRLPPMMGAPARNTAGNGAGAAAGQAPPPPPPSNGRQRMVDADTDEECNCICRQPMASWAGEPMVCCDKCEVWFHTHCIGMHSDVHSQLVQQDSEWFCHLCSAAADLESAMANTAGSDRSPHGGGKDDVAVPMVERRARADDAVDVMAGLEHGVLTDSSRELVPGRPVCLCAAPYSHDMLLVRCQHCERAFHPSCVGLGGKTSTQETGPAEVNPTLDASVWDGSWRCDQCPRYSTRVRRRPSARAILAAEASGTAAGDRSHHKPDQERRASPTTAVPVAAEASQPARPKLTLTRRREQRAAPGKPAVTTSELERKKPRLTLPPRRAESCRAALPRPQLTLSPPSSDANAAAATACPDLTRTWPRLVVRGATISGTRHASPPGPKHKTQLVLGGRRAGGVRMRGGRGRSAGAGKQQLLSCVRLTLSSALSSAAADAARAGARAEVLRQQGRLTWRIGRQRVPSGGGSAVATSAAAALRRKPKLIIRPRTQRPAGIGPSNASSVASATSAVVPVAAQPQDGDHERFCPVCLSEEVDMMNPVMTPCRHWFCRECLVRSSKQCGRRYELTRKHQTTAYPRQVVLF